MRTLIFTLFVLVLVPVEARPQTARSAQGPLRVGTKEAPPFVIRNADGSWSGISIDLWRQMAEELHLAYELHETDLQGLIRGLQEGTLDVSVAALTVTAERETRIDFTHPFYTSGLGIATVTESGGGWLAVTRSLLSLSFLRAAGTLALLLFVVGLAVWVVERKKNPQQFEAEPSRGLISGFWWSAVTMTTVGYGDKAPVTPAGRFIALVWMFAGVILISAFTATITSSLTVAQLGSRVRGPDDLARVRVGTVPGSTSASYLGRRGIEALPFDTVEAALEALRNGKIEAVVYDAPILRYLVHRSFGSSLQVLPETFERQDYAIALPAGDRHRESFNRVLLSRTRTASWLDLLKRYLGN